MMDVDPPTNAADHVEIESYLKSEEEIAKEAADEKAKKDAKNENYHDPAPQPNSLTCSSYEILPYVSAVHPCSIYSVAATKNMKWVFTGGDDGFIRKYDFFASFNGEGVLTQNQKHGLVDSIQKGGVLTSAWELEEISAQPLQVVHGDENAVKKEGDQQVPAPAPKVSPVYSLAVHSEAVWCVAGTEVVLAAFTTLIIQSGNVNLYTVRHDEGQCHHVFRGHNRPVSVLVIDPLETALVTGSWDKKIILWDLNTGSQILEYRGLNSQLTSASFQPKPSAMNEEEMRSGSGDSLLMVTSFDGAINFYDRRVNGESVRKFMPSGVPPWAISVGATSNHS
ncbi:Transcription factor spt8 [Dinochytrium kinnereticum]|nr:Transcription factor spt8 [Dinochytrium kinnereticum]